MAKVKKVTDTQMLRQVMIAACPGCGLGIWGRLQVETTVLDSSDPSNIVLHGRVTGMEISHNCIPKQTRSADVQETHHPHS